PSKPDTKFADQRTLRHNLERYQGKRDPAAINAVWNYLGSQDSALRYAARTSLEFQDQTLWRDRALSETDPRRSMAAVTALARVNGRDDFTRTQSDPAPDKALQTRMVAALDRIDWYSLNYQEQLDLLRCYSLVFLREGPPDTETAAKLVAKFDSQFPA